MSPEAWFALGALIVAVVAIPIAIATLLREMHAEARDRSERVAAETRRNLRLVSARAERLTTQFGSGEPLVAASWHVLQSLKQRLGDKTTIGELAVALAENKDLPLIASDEGWSSSPATNDLRQTSRELWAVSARFTGALAFFEAATDMLNGFADGARGVLKSLLAPDDSPFLAELDQELSIDDTSFDQAFRGTLAAFAVARWSEPAKTLGEIIELTSSSLQDLEDGQLSRLARATDRAAVAQTGEEPLTQMKHDLSLLEQEIDHRRSSDIRALIERLEEELSGQYAAMRLKLLMPAPSAAQRKPADEQPRKGKHTAAK